ncbi:MAG: S41 family peptidase [Eggerthellales bacterium]|nr:S41 family peptidase [Eggerthellales bacterium]
MRALALFIALCLVFALGFFLRGFQPLMDYMGVFSLDKLSSASSYNVSDDPYDSLSARVSEVQGILESESYSSDYEIDEVTKDVLSSYADATGDPYVRYYDAAEYAKFQTETSQNYYGIGVLFGSYDNRSYVVDVFDGSIAQAKGVEVGDFVVAINGERRTDGWSLTDTINAINAQEGSSVTITWRKAESLDDTGGKEIETTLSCYQADVPNVKTKMVNGVGYIKISQLGRSTSTLVSQAISDLRDKGAQGFVLDLRNVPGGYLTQAVEIVSLFQKSGVVVQIETRSGVTTKSVSGNSTCDEPLSIIVNEHTAAAAEVIAASLKGDSRATVVGQTTMGKGSVQIVRELSFGGAISYTAAYYKTPRGRDIDGIGIEPDYYVNDSEGTDIQLNRAVDSVLSQLKG